MQRGEMPARSSAASKSATRQHYDPTGPLARPTREHLYFSILRTRSHQSAFIRRSAGIFRERKVKCQFLDKLDVVFKV